MQKANLIKFMEFWEILSYENPKITWLEAQGLYEEYLHDMAKKKRGK